MSILIKGIDMPKEAGKMLHLDINQYGEVWLDDEYIGELVKEIPTPHGRLIDESKMEFYYMERWTYTEDGIIKDRTRYYKDEDVLKTPTILEAED